MKPQHTPNSPPMPLKPFGRPCKIFVTPARRGLSVLLRSVQQLLISSSQGTTSSAALWISHSERTRRRLGGVAAFPPAQTSVNLFLCGGSSSAGRASDCGSESRGFKSRLPPQLPCSPVTRSVAQEANHTRVVLPLQISGDSRRLRRRCQGCQVHGDF